MNLSFDLMSIAEGLGQFVAFAGVIVIAGGVIFATISFLSTAFKVEDTHTQYRAFRNNLGRAILLGLELLVAGDIIQSVGGTTSLQDVLILGLIVLIRSFLGITFEMEVEGRWPWNRGKSQTPKS
jgi:uncharacterized membrane protein